MIYVTYDDIDGKILSIGNSEVLVDNELEVQSDADIDLHYIDLTTMKVSTKTNMDIHVSSYSTNINTPITISDIPNPTMVYVNGPVMSEHNVTNESMTLSFDTPGEYYIEFNSTKFFDDNIVINII